MRNRRSRTLLLWTLFASLGVLACDASSLLGGITPQKPIIVMQSPANGSQFREGEEVTVQSTAQDAQGIVRVELYVDGASVRSDAPPVPQGQVSFSLVQRWQAIQGTHTLSVRAFNAAGLGSDPALVMVTVLASTAMATVAPGEPTRPGADPGPTLTIPLASPTATAPLATATRRPPTRVPATPTIKAPPGVYALSVRVDPATPKRGSPPTFYVTFLNSTGKVQQYRWFVKVYEPDKPNAKGETSKIGNDFPPGTFELAAPADWAIRGPGPCEPFFARVFWYDKENSQTTEFVKPDASGGPAAGFQICP